MSSLAELQSSSVPVTRNGHPNIHGPHPGRAHQLRPGWCRWPRSRPPGTWQQSGCHDEGSRGGTSYGVAVYTTRRRLSLLHRRTLPLSFKHHAATLLQVTL
jgi:hypothetical protein